MLARDRERDVRLYADVADGEDARLLGLIADALPLPGGSPYEVFPSQQLLDGSSSSGDAEPRRLLRGAGVDLASVAGRSGALLWACAADGVAGVLENEQDVALFAREAVYRAGLRTDGRAADAAIFIGAAGALEERAQAAAEALSTHGAAVLHGFLGSDAADELELWAAAPGGEDDAFTFGEGKPGAGRGDTACLPDALPTALLARLDELVAAVGAADNAAHGGDGAGRSSQPPGGRGMGMGMGIGLSCSERLQRCRFRSWPMLATYEPGNRYTYHLDNPRGRNGRLLTMVYYLNRGWTSDDGGVLRLLRPPTGSSSADGEGSEAGAGSSSAGGEGGETGGGAESEEKEVPSEVIAEVVPTLDTLALFWSDRVPHEVLPPTGGSHRRAVSVWYLCPSQGPEQFTDGSLLPVGGLGMSEAAAGVLAAAEASGGPHVAPEALEWLRAQATGVQLLDPQVGSVRGRCLAERESKQRRAIASPDH